MISWLLIQSFWPAGVSSCFFWKQELDFPSELSAPVCAGVSASSCCPPQKGREPRFGRSTAFAWCHGARRPLNPQDSDPARRPLNPQDSDPALRPLNPQDSDPRPAAGLALAPSALGPGVSSCGQPRSTMRGNLAERRDRQDSRAGGWGERKLDPGDSASGCAPCQACCEAMLQLCLMNE